MQVSRSFIALLAICCLSAGCSNHYVMTTNEGAMIMANGKPRLDSKTGVLSYTDEDGNTHQINNNQISGVIIR